MIRNFDNHSALEVQSKSSSSEFFLSGSLPLFLTADVKTLYDNLNSSNLPVN